MKQFWTDLKSFITISMIGLLYIVIIANLFGFTIQENLLLLVTNLITSVFTYYFTKAITKNSDIDTKIDVNNSDIDAKDKN